MEFFRRNGTGLALIMATLLAAGCTGKFNEDDDDNVVALNDSTGPVVKITFPPASSLTDSTTVVVTGTASDSSGIQSILVNGAVATTQNGYQDWSAIVSLPAGWTQLSATGTDVHGNNSSASKSPMINNAPGVFGDLESLAYDANTLTAWMLDAGGDAIVAVNTVTGTRVVLANDYSSGGTDNFSSPSNVAYDSNGNRLLIIDYNQDRLVAINLASGTLSVVSDNTIAAGDADFQSPRGLAFDPANNRALVTDSVGDCVFGVNLSTGYRTVLSDAARNRLRRGR